MVSTDEPMRYRLTKYLLNCVRLECAVGAPLKCADDAADDVARVEDT